MKRTFHMGCIGMAIGGILGFYFGGLFLVFGTAIGGAVTGVVLSIKVPRVFERK